MSPRNGLVACMASRDALEALLTHDNLSRSDLRVLLALVWHLSLYQRESDRVALSQVAAVAHVSYRQVQRSVAKLAALTGNGPGLVYVAGSSKKGEPRESSFFEFRPTTDTRRQYPRQVDDVGRPTTARTDPRQNGSRPTTEQAQTHDSYLSSSEGSEESEANRRRLQYGGGRFACIDIEFMPPACQEAEPRAGAESLAIEAHHSGLIVRQFNHATAADLAKVVAAHGEERVEWAMARLWAESNMFADPADLVGFVDKLLADHGDSSTLNGSR